MKCDSCSSCRKVVWIDNKVYYICYLCKRIWKVVKDEEILGEEKEELLGKLNMKVLE